MGANHTTYWANWETNLNILKNRYSIYYPETTDPKISRYLIRDDGRDFQSSHPLHQIIGGKYGKLIRATRPEAFQDLARDNGWRIQNQKINENMVKS